MVISEYTPPMFTLFLLACAPAAKTADSGATGLSLAGPDSPVIVDNDADGYAEAEDCDDDDRTVYPGAVEVCNGHDDNCDGTTDETGSLGETPWHPDADSDGYGDPVASTVACVAPPGWVADASDCDDADGSVSPAAVEQCNHKDDDCDGEVDEAGATGEVYAYPDADNDGYGLSAGAVRTCDPLPGYAPSGDECDDNNAAINPGANELCDGLDNDCSDTVDDGGVCPCPVEYNDDVPYLYCMTELTWADAASSCATVGYALVALEGPSEETWVVDTANTHSTAWWWAGGNDLAVEDDWRWPDGSLVSNYTNWHSGEPNNSAGAGTQEDCIHLNRFADYTWNDNDCDYASYYICEGPN